jgi:hypothetical protein
VRSGRPAAVGLANGYSPVEAGHRAIGEAHQLVVPLDDLHPVGLLDRLSVGLQRGNGGLGLELAQSVAGKRCREHVDALGDQVGVPEAAVLLSKRHDARIRAGPLARVPRAKLRAKELVLKAPQTHTYRPTPRGFLICLLFMKLFQRVYAPLAAGVLRPIAHDIHLPDTDILAQKRVSPSHTLLNNGLIDHATWPQP